MSRRNTSDVKARTQGACRSRKITTIEVPEAPSNVCFGGKDRKTLFITRGRGSIRSAWQSAGSDRRRSRMPDEMQLRSFHPNASSKR